MADKNVNVGNEVPCNGNSVGAVATSSAISAGSGDDNTTKGDAGEDNSAVHTSRDENDVVNRTTEPEEKEVGENNGDGESRRENERENEKRKPEAGEKRSHSGANEGPETTPERGRELEEKADGRGPKKPKIGEVKDTGPENGSNKTNDNGDKKDGNQETGQEEPAVKGIEREVQKAPKKRGPGRPRKGESKGESKVEKTSATVKETNSGDSIGRRTRSKTYTGKHS